MQQTIAYRRGPPLYWMCSFRSTKYPIVLHDGGTMQIDTLRYFVELARVGSFYGASKNVFISQQGLNRAISSLESELGVKLVERESRGVRLTSSGEVLLEHSAKLLLEYSDMLKDLYAQHTTSSLDDARIVIHMTYYPSQVSEPFVRSMKDSRSIKIVEEPFQQIIEGARESDGSELFLCDLYGAHDRASDFNDLVFEPVITTRGGIVWRGKPPIKILGAVHREQIADMPLTVDSHREMMRFAEYIMQDYPLNNIRMGVANPKGRIEYTSASDDVASMYDSFGYELIQASPKLADKSLHFAPFSTPRSIAQVGFFYNKKARPNVRARHIIEVLRQHIRNNYADYLQKYPI